MTDFNTISQSENLKPNYVIKITGSNGNSYFANHQPDSGLSIVNNNLGVIKSVTDVPISIDFKHARSSTKSVTVKIIDINNSFNTFRLLAGDFLMDAKIEVWLGYITGSFNFSNYKKVYNLKVRDIKQKDLQFDLKCYSNINKLENKILDSYFSTDYVINETDTQIEVVGDQLTSFPNQTGYVMISDELCSYSTSSYDSTTNKTRLDGVQRGLESSEIPDSYPIGTVIRPILYLNDNPINILLKLMISSSGDGSIYDVYSEGGGINSNDIDITSFTNIRDTYFSGEIFQFKVYSIENILSWLETYILSTCNIRLTDSNSSGLISLITTFQTTSNSSVIDSNTLLLGDSMSISKKDIQNVVTVKYDYQNGSGEYLSNLTLRDEYSISKYGVIKGSDIYLRGITSGNNGYALATNRGNKFLNRFAYPTAKINFTTLVKNNNINVGDSVNYQSKSILDRFTTDNINENIEIVTITNDFDRGLIRYEGVISSFNDIKAGVISLSLPISSVTITNNKTLIVPSEYISCFVVGYVYDIYNNSSHSYFGENNVVESVNTSTNTVTFTNDFTNLNNAYYLKFPEYSLCSNDQKRNFVFISEGEVAINNGVVSGGIDGDPTFKIS